VAAVIGQVGDDAAERLVDPQAGVREQRNAAPAAVLAGRRAGDSPWHVPFRHCMTGAQVLSAYLSGHGSMFSGNALS
jgi:hypothetical protein